MWSGLKVRAALALLLAGTLSAGAISVYAAGDDGATTTRASVSSAEVQGDARSYGYSNQSISTDGRYVVFQSYATNLVSGDTNGWSDIFLRDRVAGTTTRVNTIGDAGNNDSNAPSISADGRFVVFESYASDLRGGDTNGYSDVFVYERSTGALWRASLTSAGEQSNGGSYASAISSDGRYVAFLSGATNLVSDDTNGVNDIFVRDRTANTTTRVSVSTTGVEGNDYSGTLAISGDGRYVAFGSGAANLVSDDTNGVNDIFVRDRTANTTIRASVSTAGIQGNGYCDCPAISANGRYIAFESDATNLVEDDTNGRSDIFVRDLVAGTTVRASVGSSGAQSDEASYFSSISSDGRYVVFHSYATNLADDDVNGVGDVFVRDMIAGTTTRVSLNTAGLEGDGESYEPAISTNGRYVVFNSSATNLVDDDTNAVSDVFVRDRDSVAPTTTSDAKDSYIGPTVITLSATDNLLGVDRTEWRVGTSGVWTSGVKATLNTAGAHTLQFRSIDKGGNIEVAKSVAVTVVPASTTLALTSKSNSSLAYGATFKVTGTLKSGSTGLSGKQVILQAAAPGKAFKDTSYKTTTTSGGAFTFYVKPSAKTSYKVRFAAGGAYGASTSGSVYATPKVSLSAPKAPKTMKRSKRYTVYGSLKPKHTAGTKPVRIYKYKKVGKKWVKKGYVTAKAYTYKSHTRYKVKVKLTSKGTWRLRAYAPADSLHAATWSAKYDTVKVK